jgi:hypothetical protein
MSDYGKQHNFVVDTTRVVHHHTGEEGLVTGLKGTSRNTKVRVKWDKGIETWVAAKYLRKA